MTFRTFRAWIVDPAVRQQLGRLVVTFAFFFGVSWMLGSYSLLMCAVTLFGIDIFSCWLLVRQRRIIDKQHAVIMEAAQAVHDLSLEHSIMSMNLSRARAALMDHSVPFELIEAPTPNPETLS